MDNENERPNSITGSGGDYYFITDNPFSNKLRWKIAKPPEEKELVPIYCFNCKKHIDWAEEPKGERICDECTNLPSELKVPEGHMEEYYESRTQRGEACHECGQHPCECVECTSCSVRYVMSEGSTLPKFCTRHRCPTRLAKTRLIVRPTHAIYYDEEEEERDEYEDCDDEP